jgi:hypothetical protein
MIALRSLPSLSCRPRRDDLMVTIRLSFARYHVYRPRRETAAAALHDVIEQELGWTAVVPRYLERVWLD